MKNSILWLERAVDKLDSISEYIRSEWGHNASQDFINKAITRINLLTDFAELGVKSTKRKNIRKLIISKYTSAYYLIKRDKIIILTLFLIHVRILINLIYKIIFNI